MPKLTLNGLGQHEESESDMSEDSLYKSLVTRGDLLKKGCYPEGCYPDDRVTQWADQFYGTPFHVEALKLLKEKSQCEADFEQAMKGEKTWREQEDMPRTERQQYRNERAKLRDTWEKKRHGIIQRQTALEVKLVDHRIAESERQAAAMGKSLDTDDDLEKAGEGSGKAIYAHHGRMTAAHKLKSDLHHKRALEHTDVRRAAMHMKLAAMHREASESHGKAREDVKHSKDANKKTSDVEESHKKMAERFKKACMKKSLSEDDMDDLSKAGGEGSRGGTVIGHTAGGKPIYASKHASEHLTAGMKQKLRDHVSKTAYHAKKADESKHPVQRHKDAAQAHNTAAKAISLGWDNHKMFSKIAGEESSSIRQQIGLDHIPEAAGFPAPPKPPHVHHDKRFRKSAEPFDHRVEGLPFNLATEPVVDDMSKAYTHGQTSFGAGELIDEMADIRQAGANGGMPAEDVKEAREKIYSEPETCVTDEIRALNSPFGRSY
jgi:hypothetical protein